MLFRGEKNEERANQTSIVPYNILRSMSKGVTPTDNAIIEALNGWIKEELYPDFDLANTEDVPRVCV